MFLKENLSNIFSFPLDHDKEIIEQAIKAKDIQPTGQIVGIIRRKWRQYCGMLQENPSGTNATKHIFVPAEKKIPKIRIETRQAGKLKGQRIIVAADAWPRLSFFKNLFRLMIEG